MLFIQLTLQPSAQKGPRIGSRAERPKPHVIYSSLRIICPLPGEIPLAVPPAPPQATVTRKGPLRAPLGRSLLRLLNLNVAGHTAGEQFYGMGTAAMFEGELVTPEASTLSTM
jgi:hypothetical protein